MNELKSHRKSLVDAFQSRKWAFSQMFLGKMSRLANSRVDITPQTVNIHILISLFQLSCLLTKWRSFPWKTFSPPTFPLLPPSDMEVVMQY